MAEDIQDLIDKIQQEGIRAAEEKAQQIEADARKRAEDIRSQAQRDAEEMIANTRNQVRLEEERGRALLAQAGRDLLLSLRSEINIMLGRLIVSEIRPILTPEMASELIQQVVRQYGSESNSVTIELNKDTLDVLERYFLRKLEEEIKKPIILRPSTQITGGFTISFDSGRSCFDFTDSALGEYLGTYLKPKLNQILVPKEQE